MKISFYPESFESGISRKEVKNKTVEFRMSMFSVWKSVISDCRKRLVAGVPEIVRIKPIRIPKHSFFKQVTIPRHPNLILLSLLEPFHTGKMVTHAAVLPLKDTEIEPDDLLGVFEIQFIGTGIFKNLRSKKIPEIIGMAELTYLNLVFPEGKKLRLKVSNFEYRAGKMAYWLPIISKESKEVERGKIEEIRIREINLPQKTIVKPLCGINHALGSVLALLGDLKLVEENRKVRKAIFMPLEDGRIEDGDLLGALNVYYLAGVSQFDFDREMKVMMSYKEDGEVKRVETKRTATGYLRSFSGSFTGIVAKETRSLRKGEPVLLKIRELIIPANAMPSLTIYPTHACGCVLDLRMKKPKRIEEEKKVEEVLFFPFFDCEIQADDFLGFLCVHELLCSWNAMEVKPEYLDRYLVE